MEIINLGGVLFTAGFGPNVKQVLQAQASEIARSLNASVNFGASSAGASAAASSAAALNREAQAVKNLAQAGAISARDAAAQLAGIRDRALAGAKSLQNLGDTSSTELSRLAAAAASANRSLATLQGKSAPLSIGSIISTQLQSVTTLAPQAQTGLSGVAAAAATVGPLGAAAGAGLLAAAAGFNAVANNSADFEQSLADAKGTLGATPEQMREVGDASSDLARDLGVLKTEAAQVFEALGTAGIDTEDALDGVARSSILIAKATKESLETSASVGAQVSQNFEDVRGNFDRIADITVNAANRTRLTVKDLNEAIGQGGRGVAIAKIPYADFVTLVAAIRPAASSASDAATALSNSVQRIYAPTKEGADILRQWGVSAYDSSGRARQFIDVVGDIARATKNQTEEQRNANLQVVLGSDGLKGLLPLIKAGADSLRDQSKAMEEQGTAFDQYRERTDTLRGAQDRLSKAVQNLLTVNAKDSPLLRGLTNVYDVIANIINAAADPVTFDIRLVFNPEAVRNRAAQGNRQRQNEGEFGDVSGAQITANQDTIGELQKQNGELTRALEVARQKGLETFLDAAVKSLDGKTLITTIEAARKQVDDNLARIEQLRQEINRLKQAAPTGPDRPSPDDASPAPAVTPPRSDELFNRALAQQRRLEGAREAFNQAAALGDSKAADVARQRIATIEVEIGRATKASADYGQAIKDAERYLAALKQAREQQERAREQQERARQEQATQTLRDNLGAPREQLERRLAAERQLARSANQIEREAAAERVRIIEGEFSKREDTARREAARRSQQRNREINETSNQAKALTSQIGEVNLEKLSADQLKSLRDRQRSILEDAQRLGVADAATFKALSAALADLTNRFKALDQARKALDKGGSPGFADFGAALRAGLTQPTAEARSLESIKEAERTRQTREQAKITDVLRNNLELATSQRLRLRLAQEEALAKSSNAQTARAAAERVEIIRAELDKRTAAERKARQEIAQAERDLSQDLAGAQREALESSQQARRDFFDSLVQGYERAAVAAEKLPDPAKQTAALSRLEAEIFGVIGDLQAEAEGFQLVEPERAAEARGQIEQLQVALEEVTSRRVRIQVDTAEAERDLQSFLEDQGRVAAQGAAEARREFFDSLVQGYQRAATAAEGFADPNQQTAALSRLEAEIAATIVDLQAEADKFQLIDPERAGEARGQIEQLAGVLQGITDKRIRVILDTADAERELSQFLQEQGRTAAEAAAEARREFFGQLLQGLEADLGAVADLIDPTDQLTALDALALRIQGTIADLALEVEGFRLVEPERAAEAAGQIDQLRAVLKSLTSQRVSIIFDVRQAERDIEQTLTEAGRTAAEAAAQERERFFSLFLGDIEKELGAAVKIIDPDEQIAALEVLGRRVSETIGELKQEASDLSLIDPERAAEANGQAARLESTLERITSRKNEVVITLRTDQQNLEQALDEAGRTAATSARAARREFFQQGLDSLRSRFGDTQGLEDADRQLEGLAGLIGEVEAQIIELNTQADGLQVLDPERAAEDREGIADLTELLKQLRVARDKALAAARPGALTQGFSEANQEFQDELRTLQEANQSSVDKSREDFNAQQDAAEKMGSEIFDAGLRVADVFKSAIVEGARDGSFNIAGALASAGESVANSISQQVVAAQAGNFAKEFAAGGFGQVFGAASSFNPVVLGLGIAAPIITGLLSNAFGGQESRRADATRVEQERASGRNRTVSTLTFINNFYQTVSFNGDFGSPAARDFVRSIARDVAAEIYDQRRRLEG
ncbi:MAG: phage tail tape measure protein [Meiothermus sp.]|nr:phage tail tape measure protein [Meiothermus sp.]